MPFAVPPTRTRVWCRKGRRGQRLGVAPGAHAKGYGVGLVDWGDGWVAGRLAPGGTAAAFCAPVRAAGARAQARGRGALGSVANLRPHTAAGARRVRQMLAALPGPVSLVYTPAYDPAANRIEGLGRISRRAITHNQQRETWVEVQADIVHHFARLSQQPDDVLRHRGSAFAEARSPTPTVSCAA